MIVFNCDTLEDREALLVELGVEDPHAVSSRDQVGDAEWAHCQCGWRGPLADHAEHRANADWTSWYPESPDDGQDSLL